MSSLDLTPDDSAFTNPDTQLRNIEEMQMRDPAFVRLRSTNRSPSNGSRPSHCPSW